MPQTRARKGDAPPAVAQAAQQADGFFAKSGDGKYKINEIGQCLIILRDSTGRYTEEDRIAALRKIGDIIANKPTGANDIADSLRAIHECVLSSAAASGTLKTEALKALEWIVRSRTQTSPWGSKLVAGDIDLALYALSGVALDKNNGEELRKKAVGLLPLVVRFCDLFDESHAGKLVKIAEAVFADEKNDGVRETAVIALENLIMSDVPCDRKQALFAMEFAAASSDGVLHEKTFNRIAYALYQSASYIPLDNECVKCALAIAGYLLDSVSSPEFAHLLSQTGLSNREFYQFWTQGDINRALELCWKSMDKEHYSPYSSSYDDSVNLRYLSSIRDLLRMASNKGFLSEIRQENLEKCARFFDSTQHFASRIETLRTVKMMFDEDDAVLSPFRKGVLDRAEEALARQGPADPAAKEVYDTLVMERALFGHESDFSRLMQKALDAALSSGTPEKERTAAGTFIADYCFHIPAFMDRKEFSDLLGLDSQTAKKMTDESPNWTFHGSSDWELEKGSIFREKNDMEAIFLLSQKKNGAVRGLFETCNLTYLSLYSQEQLARQYELLIGETRTQNEVLLVIQTKRLGFAASNWAMFNNPFYKQTEGQIDFIAIEPGLDSKLPEIVKNVSETLGKKIALRIWNMHGSPSAMILKSSGNDHSVDFTDKGVFMELMKYFKPGGQDVLFSCSTAFDLEKRYLFSS